MKYRDGKRGYSLQIPDNWKKQQRKLLFLITGGKVAFESPDGKASVNISVGRLNRAEWSDLSTRRKAMSDFLRTAPGKYANEYFEETAGTRLDGEINTVGFVHRNRQGYGKIISAYRNGIEYVIQSQDSNSREYEDVINGIISSFRF
jgi:hypothetical protein